MIRKYNLNTERVMATGRWIWKPGMRDTEGYIFLGNPQHCQMARWIDPMSTQLGGENPIVELAIEGRLPDLDCPGNRGHLLNFAQEAWDFQNSEEELQNLIEALEVAP